MEASLAAVAILAIVAAVWSLVIACRALGCCAQVSVSQVLSHSAKLSTLIFLIYKMNVVLYRVAQKK